MKNLRKVVLFSGLALAGVMVSLSCRKKLDTIAKITVRDSSNAVVSDCRVILKGVSTQPNKPSNLYDTAFTNAAGEAIFNFNDVYQLGQAGVAVLNIEATKNGLTGTGIIKIEEEVTNEETVFI